MPRYVPRPRVCVGMPVYNGDEHLAAAIESVLGQSYGDIELIVSDNASTDGTQDIVRAFVRADSRVKYIRLDRNVGGARNQNSLLLRTSSPLFKWAYSDDLCRPDLIEACFEALMLGPVDAVGAYSGVELVAGDGEHIEFWEDDDLGLDTDSASERLSRLLRSNATSVQFGTFRTDVLREAGGVSLSIGGEMVLPTALALRGSLVRAPGSLQAIRHHPGRRGGDRLSEARWVNPDHRRTAFPYSRSTIHLIDAVLRAPLDRREKWKCTQVVLRDWSVPRWRYVMGDLRHLRKDLLPRG